MKQLKVMMDDGLLRRFRVAALARDLSGPEVVRQLVERWVVVQEGNGVLSAGDQPVRQQVSPIGGSGEPGAAEMSPPEDSASAGRSPADSVPRAVMPCPRKARHHINHGGKPCPTCGWPHVTEGWEQS